MDRSNKVKTSERKMSLHLKIPEGLHAKLKTYAEGPHAKRSESLTGIVLTRLEGKLSELESQIKVI